MTEVDSWDIYANRGILPPRHLHLREALVDNLVQINQALPPPLSLLLLDAHRTLGEQETLERVYGDDAVAAGFVAPVTPDAPRPGHVTGAAIDVTLMWEKAPLALGSDFDAFTPQAAWGERDDLSPSVVLLRRILGHHLSHAGWVAHPREWWHWANGEDWWAAAHHCDAIYDLVEQR